MRATHGRGTGQYKTKQLLISSEFQGKKAGESNPPAANSKTFLTIFDREPHLALELWFVESVPASLFGQIHCSVGGCFDHFEW